MNVISTVTGLVATIHLFKFIRSGNERGWTSQYQRVKYDNTFLNKQKSRKPLLKAGPPHCNLMYLLKRTLIHCPTVDFKRKVNHNCVEVFFEKQLKIFAEHYSPCGTFHLM